MIQPIPIPAARTLRLIYRDDFLVAVSKPSGLMVHRSRESNDRVFLLQLLRDHLEAHVYPVHRLDRATSGVMVFALSPPDAAAIQARLECDAVKEYLTLARGETPEVFASNRELTSDAGVKQTARTEFERIATFHGCSLLRARLHSGRRHQIRRHLAHLAHQVIGDTSYGKGRINRALREQYGLPRLFLHSCRLTLRHPRHDGWLQFQDPLPDDLREFLVRLPDFDPAILDRL
ncbi:MAG: RluA family pseudouridine synthase [Planctomycetota bacterium]